ncbi:MAG TPA: HAD-IIIC family phosphatase [Ktedonobacteraceae bacterium]|nr:HAD-IIIC family phosphatase [Ktedonobacteraceae bacterium]
MTLSTSHVARALASRRQTVKCVVWDLDHTLWHGVLLEDEQVVLRSGIQEILQELDRRGILNSLASKNDEATALRKLEELGLREYFLCPQIHWSSKAQSLQTIAKEINIGLDTLAFIDDQAFEREEVAFAHPEVLCLPVEEIETLLERPEMCPTFITEDSSRRRLMYLSDGERKRSEEAFVGTSEEFLATLHMHFTISEAQEEDLPRLSELVARTHQLNTTGYAYSYEELDAFRQSPGHTLLVAELEDRFGTYGKIGLALLERQPTVWTIKLLLMSCRVASRGVGTILIQHIMQRAQQAGVRLLAEFIANERNRMMYITYKFGGFKELEQQDQLTIFENDLQHIQPFPAYVRVHSTFQSSADQEQEGSQCLMKR